MEVEMIFKMAAYNHQRRVTNLETNVNDITEDSRMSVDADATSDIYLSQVDGGGDESDSGSTNMDSEFSAEDFKGGSSGDKHIKGKCNLCGDEVRYSIIYHFAVSHFKPRLQLEISEKRPFMCPICKEELQSRMNLMTHYLGKHKKYDEWMLEIKGEEKPDWFDPNPPIGRKRHNINQGAPTTSAGISPRATPLKNINTSLTTSDNEGFDELGELSPHVGTATSATKVPPEWYCQLCHGGVTQRREVHYASQHFKEKLQKILPVRGPFLCPICHNESRHFLNLSTHYLTQHGFLKTWLQEQGIYLISLSYWFC
jgi:hypothetical protein